MRIKDLSYQFFGRLFPIYVSSMTPQGKARWWCHCECGNFIEVLGTNLSNGNTKSCGCLVSDTVKSLFTKHGYTIGTNTPYASWRNMYQRCYYTKNVRYSHYGGRGIKMCQEWHNYESFYYWAILHGWHKGLTLDRVNNDGDYSPENCEFVTRAENNRRMKRHDKPIN